MKAVAMSSDQSFLSSTALQPVFFGLAAFFLFHNRYGSADVGSARYKAAAYTQTQNKSTQTFMSRVGFELKTPAFKRAKTVNNFDRAATLIGCLQTRRRGKPKHLTLTLIF
jgi:hypothetical protein